MRRILRVGDIVVRDGRVWSGRGEGLPKADAPLRDVLVRDGRVVAVGAVETPPGVEELDARGRLVVPGFTDAHVHLAGTGLNCGPVVGRKSVRTR
ncbi:MAG: amidohydrolase family protein [Dehalococcoidia bacterium]|nr:amidohydrolase family protein [Dehalococcoidia bacterium]